MGTHIQTGPTGRRPLPLEGVRAKLKRLVSRGILTEPEPGLLTLPRSARPAPQTTSAQDPAKAHRTPSQRAFMQVKAGKRLMRVPRFSVVHPVGSECRPARRDPRRPSHPLLVLETRLT
ncbi:hypothetical protein CP972_12665 [Streptomyces prasinus]|uniref:Uncharacterized protein n=1 Tax=Streptomyces prasinus TaxID=67345 RepID=A0ABX6AUJ0_9ACTN|nr:hypothetical protein CP972_12665 [Streptomyces prasinus]